MIKYGKVNTRFRKRTHLSAKRHLYKGTEDIHVYNSAQINEDDTGYNTEGDITEGCKRPGWHKLMLHLQNNNSLAE